jgi:hypothetical protein
MEVPRVVGAAAERTCPPGHGPGTGVQLRQAGARLQPAEVAGEDGQLRSAAGPGDQAAPGPGAGPGSAGSSRRTGRSAASPKPPAAQRLAPVLSEDRHWQEQDAESAVGGCGCHHYGDNGGGGGGGLLLWLLWPIGVSSGLYSLFLLHVHVQQQRPPMRASADV